MGHSDENDLVSILIGYSETVIIDNDALKGFSISHVKEHLTRILKCFHSFT